MYDDGLLACDGDGEGEDDPDTIGSTVPRIGDEPVVSFVGVTDEGLPNILLAVFRGRFCRCCPRSKTSNLLRQTANKACEPTQSPPNKDMQLR